MTQHDKGYTERDERHVQDCFRVAVSYGVAVDMTAREIEDFRRLGSFRAEENKKDPRK